ncbi:2-amino-4-hydroxy-6-hydroxymethyldihydropteridine diphosphokinase [Cuneatibacter caecimuris]|uniref:Bifunctional folate synthesis protein n=1 Tax=Cuneatibacter caecimuris TaxID=1796618 RepID=A0A4Q7PNZ1_9FIRM|nr:2-amino-4-hydroxy-6-hydroxymethyldihydropteridine diphosphokinase [Cuneatibacter caecimuris]RZT02699.1 dihydroneopterin aldolase/2-amino-4-hydroxy-6-hydroxymethyldihydropteridine diphosphokinase [Cuneatibacter caecimuris]
MDSIKITDLEIFANHGVYPEENRLGQKFVVTAELFLDTRKAGKTDSLELSVNYGTVAGFITEYMQRYTWKLIEAAAEHTAEAVLLEFPLVREIRLEIKKPWAPVKLPLKTVSVSLKRGWHRAYIAFGSNLGEKEAYLRQGIKALEEHPLIRMGKISSFILTEPYGGVEMDDVLNGCLCLETLLTPEELLEVCQKAEQKARRERKIHWGPRTLDLDILFYDSLVLDDPQLVIPHPEIALRDFVLRPMAEIAPYFVHPVLQKTMKQLLSELKSH